MKPWKASHRCTKHIRANARMLTTSPQIRSSHVQTMSAILPPELDDRIIDFLWDDPPSLCNCALTCRAWLPASRYNLYHTIHLSTRRVFWDLVRTAIIATAPPPCFAFVQELYIEMKKNDRCSMAERKVWVNLVPYHFGKYMSNVRLLHFERLVHPFPRGFYSALSRFSAVTELHLECCSLGPFREFQLLVCALPRLSTLRVTGAPLRARSLEPEQDVDFSPDGCPYLKSLELREFPDSGVLCRWLSRTPIGLNLENLADYTLGTPSKGAEDGVSSASHLATSLGPSLRSLVVTVRDIHGTRSPPFAVSYSHIGDIVAEHHDLAPCINLESLMLRLECVDWRELARLLSQITTSSLRRLQFEFHTDAAQSADDLPFLRNFLTERFSHVERVEILNS